MTATSRQVSRAPVMETRLALSLQEGRPRQHVQDLVAGQGGLLYMLWQDQGGSLYICGKVAMARAVQVQWLARWPGVLQKCLRTCWFGCCSTAAACHE